MGCSSCGTGGCAPAGCKDNGHCSTGGCNKLNVYDWLGGMTLPPGQKQFPYMEIRFKGSRKEFYNNLNNLDVYIGDPVVVEAENGFDIGHVSLRGELVQLQMKKYNEKDGSKFLNILKQPNNFEQKRYEEIKAEEAPMLQRARTIALHMKLQMKLSDIELRGDRKKVTFFYTAEDRVDFRELIKKYADEFKTRIEMRQIGYRNEAARLGGIGSCGRELCCSTWLTDFKMVNMSAARYQNLSLNPLKLQGQCGRLKCCLNYELDTYLEALEDFPRDLERLQLDTEVGKARLLKTDILKKMMWFTYVGSAAADWIPVNTADVKRIMEMNKAGKRPQRLNDYDKTGVVEKPRSQATEEFEGNLDRMKDKTKSKNKRPFRPNNRTPKKKD